MSKILLTSDIHLSDRAPSSCTDSYTEDLFDLLEQGKQVGIERGIIGWVWAGDTFHHKAPNRVSYRLVHRVCEFIASCPFPVYVLPGNHDMSNDYLESVHLTQPLGMLYRAGAEKLTFGWCPPLKVFGVPWLPSYGPEQGEAEEVVWEVLKPFRELQQGPHPDPRYLVVAHAPLYPEGRELTYEYFPTRQWADAMGMKGQCFYGHVHEPHGEYGFYDAEGGVTFCNNGALSRGSLHEYNLTRQVGVTLWDDETGGFEFVPLDAKPASEVFRLKEKEQATDMQGRLDEFLQGVGSASLEVMSTAAVIAHVKSLGVGRDVETLVEELLSDAERR